VHPLAHSAMFLRETQKLPHSTLHITQWPNAPARNGTAYHARCTARPTRLVRPTAR